MANRFYTKARQARWTGTWTTNLHGATNLKAVLVDAADYTPDTTANGHEFLSDIPSAARVSTTAPLSNVSVVGAILDADDIALPDVGGDQAEYLILYEDTGVESTSRLILLIDTATGLPITPDSVEDTIQWDAQGIAAL